MTEIYEEGLPVTYEAIVYDNVVLSDEQEENVRVIPREKWVNDIMRHTGWKESDVIESVMMNSPQLADISAKLYGKDIISWEMPGTTKKTERFYTSHKGKEAQVNGISGMLSGGHGTVVSEKVTVKEEDNCGDTRICIHLDEDVHTMFGGGALYKAGETHCFYPYEITIKEGDKWLKATDDRFLIAELPTDGGMCRTDKHHLKYADEIEYKKMENVEPGEKKWYRRGRDYPPYKDNVKLSMTMEEKELMEWFTKEELKEMGYPKKGQYTGSLP